MRRPAAVLATAAAAAALAGCTSGSGAPDGGPPPPAAAPSASASGCTALLTRLPATLLGRARGTISVTGAASWGDPAMVLRCGVTPPGPTTTSCMEVDAVNWLVDQQAGYVRFTTYGRVPAVELVVPASYGLGSPGALSQLADAVRPLRTDRACS